MPKIRYVEPLKLNNILSLGVGIQSTTLLFMSILGEIDPPCEAAIFADTGWERTATYEMFKFLKEYAEANGVPVYKVSNGNLRTDVLDPEKRQPSLPFFVNTQRLISVGEQRQNLIESLKNSKPSSDLYLQLMKLARDNPRDNPHDDNPEQTQLHEWWDYTVRMNDWKSWCKIEIDNFDRQVKNGHITEKLTEPNIAMLRRQCTSEYKIRPIQKLVKELTGCSMHNPVTQWIGISTDEIQRMREPKERYMKFRYPLIEKRMGRSDCVNWLKNNNFEIPTRSSCVGCPFHDEHEWKALTPEEFEDACKFDEQKRENGMTHPNRDKNFFSDRVYLHRSLKPLRDRPFDKHDPQQLNLFETKDTDCDEGGCFL